MLPGDVVASLPGRRSRCGRALSTRMSSKVSPETKPEIVLLGIAEPPICNWPPLPKKLIPPPTRTSSGPIPNPSR